MRPRSGIPRRRIRAGFAAVVMLLGSLGTHGCTQLASLRRDTADERPSAPQRVEPPPPKPKLTPPEQHKQYIQSYERGLALAERGDYGVALGYFEQAVRLKPEAAEARLALGACLESIGEPLRAINEYRAVLVLQPQNADAYANLGTSYMKMYRKERNGLWLEMAREAWERSLALRPSQPDIRSYLASIQDDARR